MFGNCTGCEHVRKYNCLHDNLIVAQLLMKYPISYVALLNSQGQPLDPILS
jgi:hypothetical protein